MLQQKVGEFQLKVLVVEDHDLLRKLFLKAFPDGYIVHTASSVKEGWGLYLEHAPNIVFLDISLPDGSGHALASRIKGQNPGAFIVMTTSSDFAEDLEEANYNHVAGFITKPFDKAKINGYIDQYLATCPQIA